MKLDGIVLIVGQHKCSIKCLLLLFTSSACDFHQYVTMSFGLPCDMIFIPVSEKLLEEQLHHDLSTTCLLEPSCSVHVVHVLAGMLGQPLEISAAGQCPNSSHGETTLQARPSKAAGRVESSAHPGLTPEWRGRQDGQGHRRVFLHPLPLYFSGF